MAVKLRLSRGGTKKRPFYKIVAADARAPRDGNFLEKVGTYNPMLPKEHKDRITVVADRVQYWLKTGAEPTDRVARIFGDLGLMPKVQWTETPKKSLAGKKMQERAETKAAKLAAPKEESAA